MDSRQFDVQFAECKRFMESSDFALCVQQCHALLSGRLTAEQRTEVQRVIVASLRHIGDLSSLEEAKEVAEVLLTAETGFWPHIRMASVLNDLAKISHSLSIYNSAASHLSRALDSGVDSAVLRASIMVQLGRTTLLGLAENNEPEESVERALRHSRGACAVFRPDLFLEEFSEAVAVRSELIQARKSIRGPLRDTERSLFQAVEDADAFGAELAISNGACVDARDHDGCTPLHTAIGEGFVAIAELLLRSGASINAVDDSGFTTLHWATLSETEELLVRTAEVDIDSRDDEGLTPIMWAAMRSVRVVEWFIGRGALLNLTDDDGWSALHHAVSFNKPDNVELLLGRGADIDTRSLAGETPRDLGERLGFHIPVLAVT